MVACVIESSISCYIMFCAILVTLHHRYDNFCADGESRRPCWPGAFHDWLMAISWRREERRARRLTHGILHTRSPTRLEGATTTCCSCRWPAPPNSAPSSHESREITRKYECSVSIFFEIMKISREEKIIRWLWAPWIWFTSMRIHSYTIEYLIKRLSAFEFIVDYHEILQSKLYIITCILYCNYYGIFFSVYKKFPVNIKK